MQISAEAAYIVAKGRDAYLADTMDARILRNAGEPFLIATRGAPKTSRSVRNTIYGLARQHSRKPEECFREAEKLMPEAQRIELFSRQHRSGWKVWGNETDRFGAA